MIPSPTFNMLSSGGRVTKENKMGGQNPEPNECLPDSFEDRNFSNTGNGSIAEFEKTPTFLNSFLGHCCDADFCFPTVYSETEAIGGSSKWASQLEGQTTYPNCNDVGFPQSQIASTEVRHESMGSLEDRRDLLASLVAPQKEPFSEGHVFGYGNSTGVSCSYIAPSQPMQSFPHTIESSENWEDMSAFSEGHLMEENLSGSINLIVPPCSNPATMPNIHHTMAMMPLLTERQDTRSVSLKAIYGPFTIKFELPLTSGINELKEELSKILECELGSFRVEYKDEVGEWILMARDENVKEYLQLVTSLGNQVTKLKVHDKVPNTTNFCASGEPSDLQQGWFSWLQPELCWFKSSHNLTTAIYFNNMTGPSSIKLRLVRCPKCRQVLPEPANILVYMCGGCNTVLQAGRLPDQHGEENPSPTCETLSTKGQTEMENEIVEGPNEAGVSSECEFQLKNQWSQFSPYPNSDGPVVPHPHITTTQILGENMGSSGDWRNLFASLEEPLLQVHVSGSMWTVPPCLDEAPSRLMPTIAHTTGSSDDLRNLLPWVEEPFSAGHVSGSIDWTVPPCSVPAPSQPMPTIANTTGSSDDLRNLLPMVEEPFSVGYVSGSIDWTVPPCFVPALSQPMPTIAHTTGSSDDLRNLLPMVEEPFSARQVSGSVSWTVPSCFDPALSQLMPTIPHTMPTIPHMMPLLTERQDTRSVKLRVTYGDTTIKFNLPLTSGIRELNKEVLKRLEFELGRFRVEYEDEDGVLILIACDEDVRDYLQFLTSSGNQVFKPLVLKKVPNTANVCETCESLKQKRQ
ncbi:hypothetical protein RHGRI_038704 [Rhododendron griersonianum]|uniref:PB1 domain-containing protein n=1 Tax=Rhododendron griersonianum TaxID=479676 RepID=A0AAV6HP16_9ERIC|nr:hypothetical protein RHGRI_038704 [Rhododendron griersonianum]